MTPLPCAELLWGAMLERKTAGRITMCHRRRAIRRALEITTLAPHALFMTVGGFCRANRYGAPRRFSRARLVERSIGPAFKQQTGDEDFWGHTGGSQEARQSGQRGSSSRRHLYRKAPIRKCERASVHGPTNADRGPNGTSRSLSHLSYLAREPFEPLCCRRKGQIAGRGVDAVGG